MNKPALLVVDDDAQVLAAVRRDLRGKYRESYTIISATSGEEALATVRELKARGDELALVVSDQRMPGMQGTDVLAESLEIYPLAQARAAHGLLGHGRDGQGDQRRPSRLLPGEAVGSARGPPVPGRRRSARDVAGRASPGREGAAADRQSVVAPIARDQGLSRGQSDSLPVAGRGAQPGGARPARRNRDRRQRSSGAGLRGWIEADQSRAASGGRAPGEIAGGRAQPLRPRHCRRRPFGSRQRRCTARQRGCARYCSIGMRPAVRRAPARGSRTISDFPPASAAAS